MVRLNDISGGLVTGSGKGKLKVLVKKTGPVASLPTKNST